MTKKPVKKKPVERPARKPQRRAVEKKTANLPAGARAVWTGNLRLALVSVPVQIFPATGSGARISFHQVHKPSGKRIRYQKIVPGVGPVDTDEIVSGFELGNGRYVLIEPDEIDKLKLEAKRTLDLVQFVDSTAIDPIWFDRPYYVVPDDPLAEEAYGVLRDAMRKSQKYGLGQLVMRGREYIACIKPCGNGILLETLRFADEVKSAAPYFAEVEDAKADPEMLNLASELITRKSGAFDPAKFEDSYTEAIRELIEAKRKHQKPVEIDEDEEPKHSAEVIDLVEALKRSVRGGSKKTSSSKPATEPRRKKA